MMSSRKLIVVSRARTEITSALQYTLRTWGEAQQRAYGQRIAEVLERLTHYPNLGERRNSKSGELRAYPVGQHVVYYRVTDDAVVVLRFRAQRMDSRDLFD